MNVENFDLLIIIMFKHFDGTYMTKHLQNPENACLYASFVVAVVVVVSIKAHSVRDVACFLF